MVFLPSESIVRCEIRLVPGLKSLDGSAETIPMAITLWPFPSGLTTIEDTTVFATTRTIPELMERIPGVLVHPETGLPVFSALRTSDTGLYIDGIPVMDPADHRPAFFPPALFVENISVARAGIDVDQVSSIGGNISVESPGPGSRSFTGMAGFSEIVLNESFIDTQEARRAFDAWAGRDGAFDTPPDTSPDLTDRRYHLLLKSRTDLAHFIVAGEIRTSNRGFTSDFVNDDALTAVNTWLKASRNLDETASIAITAGYQDVTLSPEYQWRLRGQNPLDTVRTGIFGAVEFRKRFGSSFWYDVLLAGLDLHNTVDPQDRESAYEYPYGLGNWTVDSRRRTGNLVFKGGRITRLHAVETGLHFSWLDIDIIEGFQGQENTASSVSYFWTADRSDYEFSFWGRDRWFLNKHLELGLGMRWDKFNYLEESDYLSPRFYGAVNINRHRFTAGVERIIQSPGMGYIDDETLLPIDPEIFNPVTEPQQGFRWYGSYAIDAGAGLSFEIEGFYSFLTQTVVMLPIETEPGIEFIMPVSADSGRNMGTTIDALWSPIDDVKITVGYGFNRMRLAWGENMKLSFIHPYPEMPWPRVFYSEEVTENMPPENELTHAIRLYGNFRIPRVDAWIGVDYRWTSGLRYTRYFKDASGEWTYDPGRINAEHGDAVQRLDLDLRRIFDIGSAISVECHITMRNVLNEFQFPRIDPYTGQDSVDPYRLDYNQPRTMTGSVFLRF